jgi:hypothetical protein
MLRDRPAMIRFAERRLNTWLSFATISSPSQAKPSQAKPSRAGKLAAQLKNMAKAGNLRNIRVLTDLAGEFNHVIMEYEVESASEFEELIARHSSDPQAREEAKGYTDLWTTGRRDLFRVACTKLLCRAFEPYTQFPAWPL